MVDCQYSCPCLLTSGILPVIVEIPCWVWTTHHFCDSQGGFAWSCSWSWSSRCAPSHSMHGTGIFSYMTGIFFGVRGLDVMANNKNVPYGMGIAYWTMDSAWFSCIILDVAVIPLGWRWAFACYWPSIWVMKWAEILGTGSPNDSRKGHVIAIHLLFFFADII